MNERVLPTKEAVAALAAEWMAERLRAAVGEGRRASVALSGGTTPVPIYRALAQTRLPWSEVDIYWVDERCVPPSSPDSNYRMVKEALLDSLSLQPGQVFRMEAERGDVQQAARDYEALLPAELDMAVIGMGPDGHTASLFPGHPQLEERQRRVAVVLDSPKPPPCRLTLTLPALERTRHVLGLVLGRGKEEAVAALRAGRDIPAARVPHALWLLDAEAGGA